MSILKIILAQYLADDRHPLKKKKKAKVEVEKEKEKGEKFLKSRICMSPVVPSLLALRSKWGNE